MLDNLKMNDRGDNLEHDMGNVTDCGVGMECAEGESINGSLKECRAKSETGERFYAFSKDIRIVKPEFWWYGWGNIFIPSNEMRCEHFSVF